MKRKLIISFILALIVGQTAFAVPATPKKHIYTQPDGSKITLFMHGDEHFSWITDQYGTVLELGEDGFYRATTWDALRAKEPANGFRDSNNLEAGYWSSFDDPYPTNFGDRKILAVLLNFSDIKFTLSDPRQKFDNMLNQTGYSYDEASGSVRDYYVENSGNLYRPSFEVYGPVNLPQTEAYYVGEAKYARFPEAVLTALQMVAQDIDLSPYDTDSDGCIDMILFYFAGYNQAEWGGVDTIWPHQHTGYVGSVGGKRVVRYFCTSEYKGYEGEEMCGIGTTCHEFAHALGLPDLYDTDYDTNGQAPFTTGYFDLMASGNYNDNGRRPPYLSAVERNMLGWMEDIPPLNGSGNYTLAAVQNNKAYMSSANLEGEYFVYEYRSASGWDSGIPYWGMDNSSNGGLVIYHVDKSSRIIKDDVSAGYLWEWTNMINAFGSHPCYYLKRNDGAYHFPGPYSVNSFTPLDWDGAGCGIELTNIAVDGTKASFTVSALGTHELRGTVTAVSGGAISGATVTLSKAAFSLESAAATDAPAYPASALTTTTDAQGAFVFDLAGNNTTDFVLSVNKAGFEPQARNVSFPTSTATKTENFSLAAAEGTLSSLGYAYVNTADDTPALVPAGGKTVYRINWEVDGVSMTTPTAKQNLAAGEHRYVVTVTYYDGSSETLYYFYTK
ncbi:MAG: M6 family metalloprotease domain-containing protein [Bacteroidales bacterium]|nr:M6 family metalloprotease domain-containing protein [Bacteroidales bacterium]